MTTETTDTNNLSPANTPLALKLTEGLGVTPGVTVRVIDPSRYTSSFAAKVRNRDALVLAVGPTFPYGAHQGRAKVRFLKRDGRGKEFEEWLRVEDLTPNARLTGPQRPTQE